MCLPALLAIVAVDWRFRRRPVLLIGLATVKKLLGYGSMQLPAASATNSHAAGVLFTTDGTVVALVHEDDLERVAVAVVFEPLTAVAVTV
jgi:hypothetical protein